MMARFVGVLLVGFLLGYFVTEKDAVQQRALGFNHGVQTVLRDEVTKNACLKVLFDIQEENNTRKKK